MIHTYQKCLDPSTTSPQCITSHLALRRNILPSSTLLSKCGHLWMNPKIQDGDDHNAKQNCTSRWLRPPFIVQSLFWISRSLSGFTAHVSKHHLRSNSKSWRFHFSRYKSLIRRWTIVMSSLSVAPKTISNMYPVAAMWVTEGWTQHQTLEYLCSYDHQNQLLVKSRKCSLLFVLSMLKYMIRWWTSVQSQSLIKPLNN